MSNLHDTCWYCGVRPAEASAAFKMLMYANVVKKGKWKTWDRKSVNIPRCSTCKYRHLLGQLYVLLILLLLFLIPGIGSFVQYLFTGNGGSTGGLCITSTVLYLAAVFILTVWIRRVTKETKPAEEHGKEYPLIKEFEKQGWKIGPSPAPE